MPRERIALGYNAVDNRAFAERAARARSRPDRRVGLPARPYFVAVNRFVPEKNLVALVEAYARYRSAGPDDPAWDLMLCGGGPGAEAVERPSRRAAKPGRSTARGSSKGTSCRAGWRGRRPSSTRA